MSSPVPIAVAASAAAVLAEEPVTDRTVFQARLDRYWPDLVAGLVEAYGAAGAELAAVVVDLGARAFVQRPEALRLLDLRRHIEPGWFQAPSAVGYAAYADRFAGTLRGVIERVPYLAELGVTYLHLMPLLKPRPQPNDGGYAVMDYRSIREDLGTFDDIVELTDVLRQHGISLTLDLVLNHVAAEHEWARRARAGEEKYRRYFHVFPDRTEPDAYERTLPEVFPDFAPGNFTWNDELESWVWTTFNSWQWDLNWHNPDVFLEFVDLICFLANRGVECLRLDAIAFIWKRRGTDSQNQPEVHSLTQALHALTRIVAPALVFKAEAIVGPQQLVPYLGVGSHFGKVSDLAYHNSLMVHTWSALASRDVRLMTEALRQFPPKPSTSSWTTYVRCHDDIGWAISDEDAAAVGLNGFAHRAFLSDFYSGDFPGSDARGLVFQRNPATGDRRISGTTASLAGLEQAVDRGADPRAVDLAVRRLLLAHHVMLGFGGLPVLYMGDEIALLNDYSYSEDPEHADDNRWVHRPRMPWELVERRKTSGTVEHRVWHGIRHAIAVRSALRAMRASIEAEPLEAVNSAIFAILRRHPAEPLVGLFNLTEHHQWWPRWAVPLDGDLHDALSDAPPPEDANGLRLGPYDALWLTTA